MLINNIATLKEFLPAAVTLDFADIRQQVRITEREIIKPYFGKPVYDLVNTSEPTQEAAELKELMQEATAYLALAAYLPFGTTQISSAGIQIASNDNMKTAFEWQTAQLKTEAAKTGWMAIESGLEFLSRANGEALKTAWQQSQYFEQASKYLLPNLKAFQKFVFLSNSHTTFKKILPVLIDVQEEIIAQAISPGLLAKLIHSSPENAVLNSAANKAKKALAYFAMSMSFSDSMLILSDSGQLVIKAMSKDVSEAKTTAPEKLVERIAESYRTKADGALTELCRFCQENIADLPEYVESSNYTEEMDGQEHIARNNPNHGIAFF